MTDDYNIRIVEDIYKIGENTWNKCAGFANDSSLIGNPFLSFEFFSALQDSGSIGFKTGWIPYHIILEKNNNIIAILPNFVKTHSWGEYVFDQIFANAYKETGNSYYPKLLSCVPFSPVTGPRFLVGDTEKTKIIEIFSKIIKRTVINNKLSSANIIFLEDKEEKILIESSDWINRINIQFHWENNEYNNFNDFLSSLSSSKRKSIRKERDALIKSSISYKLLSGDEISEKYIEYFYKFYSTTVEKKWGQAYLNKDFWILLTERLKNRILLVIAEKNNIPFAGAINLFDNFNLYGRNWGTTKNIKFLHFEVCYYKAIEYAIDKNLKKVEAGAQGIHKLQRGYIPKLTKSVHYYKDDKFRKLISNYLKSEKKEIKKQFDELSKHLPYKN